MVFPLLVPPCWRPTSPRKATIACTVSAARPSIHMQRTAGDPGGRQTAAPLGSIRAAAGSVRAVTATDLDVGAFSDDPPWEVDPEALKWRAGIDQLRIRTRAEVPALVRRRRI